MKNILLLRIRKFLLTQWYALVYSRIPFEIASCDIDIANVYENYPGPKLAEFDLNGKHWLIFTK